MIHFNECDVIINGTGMVAESASISEENSLFPMQCLGFSKTTLVPNGGVLGNVQINYRMILNNDPNLLILEDLKKQPPVLEIINLEIGGLQSCGFLKNYSLSSLPNEPIKASASYILYSPVSGQITKKRETVEYGYDIEKHLHGWTTYVKYNETGWLATYRFDYGVELNYFPVYVIGKKESSQIIFQGGQERVDLVKEDYIKLDFSGSGINRIFSSLSNNVEINGLGRLSDPASESLNLNFPNSKIVSTKLDASLNSYVKGEISIERVF